MEFHQTDWLGRWHNFESYLTSTDPYMQAAWRAADWPFRCLLAMEPMPPRTARQSGGLLSHLHFQYASGPEHLFDPETNTLRSPMWYATMCDAAGTLLEQCNIVRALHRLPLWAELPEK